MKRRQILFIFCLLAGALLWSVPELSQQRATLAQVPGAPSENECNALIESAMDRMGDNCGSLRPNNICYGFNAVQANFAEPVPDNFFSQPSDIAQLSAIASVRTAPLNVNQNVWGLAAMRVMANIPNSLPGQGALFILMGDAEIQNEVPQGEALILPEEPLDVRVASDTQVVSFPPNFGNRQSRPVGDVLAGTNLQADGVSPDGQWLRVLFEYDASEASRRATAWVNRLDLEAADISDLPTIEPQSRTPMQAFTLSGGIGQPQCEEVAPSSLVVQGPANYEVDITANGVDVRVTSTVRFEIRNLNRQTGRAVLRVTPITGSAVLVDPNDPDNNDTAVEDTEFVDIEMNVSVDPETGEQTFTPVEPPQQIRARWNETPPEERARGTQIVNNTQFLVNLPPETVNYVPVPVRIIRPSGIGDPIPEFTESDRELFERDTSEGE